MPNGSTSVDLAPFLSPQRVLVLAPGCTKEESLRGLSDLVATAPVVTDRAAFRRAILEREEVSSTGIGGGVAVPHAKLPSITGFAIGIGISRAGIDFAARDCRPVDIMIMIAATDRDRDGYLRVLATVAGRLKNAAVLEGLRAASGGEAAIAALTAH